MESEGVLELYNRSVERYGIHYNPFIGDGDSSAYSTIDKQRPYGAAFFVRKEECVNHVTKRMGTNLRKLIKDLKGKKLKDGKGISGKGRLTLARVDAMQNFYGRTIRDNKGNASKMSKETWAILSHYASTPDNLNHENCPQGEKSWCSYQRDIATGSQTYRPSKFPFTPAIIDAVTPIFNRLADNRFLEGCKNVSNQNANECFNSLLWTICPKEQYISPMETSLSINLAVCLYNSGTEYSMVRLFERAGLCYNESSQRQWRQIDRERIYDGDYAVREDRKQHRKLKKRSQIKQQDAFQHIEGIQYQPQGFHTNEAR